MARLTIEDCWWTDPRRERLSEAVGGIDHADVVAVKAWRLAQEFWKQAYGLVPKGLFDRLKHPDALVAVGLAEVRGETVYVRGSKDYLTWAAEMRAAASVGGKKSAKRPRDALGRLQKSSKRTPSGHQAKSKAHQVSDSDSVFDSDLDSGFGFGTSSELEKSKGGSGEAVEGGETTEASASPSSGVWLSYSKAFEERYGTQPLRNATVNSQLKSFVARVGSVAAPDVAAFYLTHSDAYYIRQKHPVGMLLRDAEKLYAEWKTGSRVTGTSARQQERLGNAQDQLERIARGEL